MKSSGSKTLSALSVLMLFASIFFISCGLPKNPFIVTTILESDSIEYITPGSSIYFTIKNINDIFTINGINLFYCYSNSPNIILSNTDNLKLIDSITYNNPQHIETNPDVFKLYIFRLGDENTFSFPSIIIDDILLLLSGNTSLDGKIIVTTNSDNINLDLSLYLTTDPTSDLLSDGRLVRYSEIGNGKDSIILDPDDYEYSEYVNVTDEDYYLHLFGSYYVKEPAFEIDHDSIVADTQVTYLGSVKLP